MNSVNSLRKQVFFISCMRLFLLFLQSVSVYFLIYSERVWSQVCLSRCCQTVFCSLLHFSAQPTICRGNDAFGMSSAEMMCGVFFFFDSQSFQGVLQVLCTRQTQGCLSTLQGEPLQCTECLMVCVKSSQNVCF